MAEELTIGYVGNPNCGKTTQINAYTGANLKVANWPGVTVEKKEGRFQYHDREYKLVDLPGTYSLTSYTMEEQVTRQYILSDDVDVIIDVADASSLGRNLYLTLQLIELGKPVILALNMMDIVEKRGMEIDTHRLPEMLGIPVIPVSARRKTKKPLCANVDFYSGFIYEMIGLPQEIYTPIFAMSRIVGWMAHRIEELNFEGRRIIRPAYKSVMEERTYLPLAER